MNTVVWYDSDETGAPTLNNVAGSAIGVLDACLVNGFNAKSVTSLVVASGVATATISAHGYGVGRMVDFAGATPSGLNGRKKVLSTTNNTVTFDATGITDQTATGTITAKRSPLGWAKTYSGTNKAAYSRTDPSATAMMLRVVDDGTSNYWARAVMYETMSDVDTGTGSTYTSYDGTGGHYIYKGVNDATAKKWILIGDGKTFYLFTEYHGVPFASTGALSIFSFGDFVSFRASDNYQCLLSAGYSTNQTYGSSLPYKVRMSYDSDANDGLVAARGAAGIGSYKKMGIMGPATFNNVYSTGVILGGADFPGYPSPISGGMVVEPRMLVWEKNSGEIPHIRGYLRGAAFPLHYVGNSLHKSLITGVSGFAGEYLAVAINTRDTAGYVGCLFFNLTGPW